MDANPLNRYPQVRSTLYGVQWTVTGIQTVASAYFAFALGSIDAWPQWFLASLAVTPVLWSYLGVTAQTNTLPIQSPHAGGWVEPGPPIDED